MRSVFRTIAHTNKKFIKHQLKLKHSGRFPDSRVYAVYVQTRLNWGTYISRALSFEMENLFIQNIDSRPLQDQTVPYDSNCAKIFIFSIVLYVEEKIRISQLNWSRCVICIHELERPYRAPANMTSYKQQPIDKVYDLNIN